MERRRKWRRSARTCSEGFATFRWKCPKPRSSTRLPCDTSMVERELVTTRAQMASSSSTRLTTMTAMKAGRVDWRVPKTPQARARPKNRTMNAKKHLTNHSDSPLCTGTVNRTPEAVLSTRIPRGRSEDIGPSYPWDTQRHTVVRVSDTSLRRRLQRRIRSGGAHRGCRRSPLATFSTPRLLKLRPSAWGWGGRSCRTRDGG